MEHWLASPHVKADVNVLSQMREFASSVKSSKIMSELATRVAKTIDARVRLNPCVFISLPVHKARIVDEL